MTIDGKLSDRAADFYLKEYECLRKEIVWLLQDWRTLERNVVFAVGVTFGWLAVHPDLVKKASWAWGLPFFFAVLGWIRSSAVLKSFGLFSDYIRRVEGAFRGADQPEGWEHFNVAQENQSRKHWISRSGNVFWLLLILTTVAVPVWVALCPSK